MQFIAPAALTSLVQWADMARVNGSGMVFGQMLEELGIRDVKPLAALHTRLRQYNQQERLACRSPTLEEEVDWIVQATALRKLATY